MYYISVLSKKDFFVLSEAGWISNASLILTINNQYYHINLSQFNLRSVKGIVHYGRQQVNNGLFISIVTGIKLPPPIFLNRMHTYDPRKMDDESKENKAAKVKWIAL